MSTIITMELVYRGQETDDHEIDMYDVAAAIAGFQRSLALTAHLVLTGEVITQAPFMTSQVKIYATPAEAGSWKWSTKIFIATGATLGWLNSTAADSPIGHLYRSAYDYVISEAIGAHVDYQKSLGQLYEEMKEKEKTVKPLPVEKLDAVVEKCQASITNMHRPIVMSQTASVASIIQRLGRHTQPIGDTLTPQTYSYISFTERDKRPREFVGRISSYNINTFKGRIYLYSEKRPISFMLDPAARTPQAVALITTSLSKNAIERFSDEPGADIQFTAFRNTSKTGMLKSLYVIEVESYSEADLY